MATPPEQCEPSSRRSRKLWLDRRDPALWAWLAVALMALLALLPMQAATAGASAETPAAATKAALVSPAVASAPGA